MPIYRIFVQDVGKTGYSAVRDVQAHSSLEAMNYADSRWLAWTGKHAAFPKSLRCYWPSGQTGRLSAGGRDYLRRTGQIP